MNVHVSSILDDYMVEEIRKVCYFFLDEINYSDDPVRQNLENYSNNIEETNLDSLTLNIIRDGFRTVNNLVQNKKVSKKEDNLDDVHSKDVINCIWEELYFFRLLGTFTSSVIEYRQILYLKPFLK